MIAVLALERKERKVARICWKRMRRYKKLEC